MKKIFITGISGFIGFHTALLLKKQGYEVHGIDAFIPYYDLKLKKARKTLLEAEKITVLEKNLLDERIFSSIEQLYSPDIWVHLAAQAGVRYCLEEPFSYTKNNVDSFLALLEHVKNFPQKRIIYASSSSVYGRNLKVPFNEDDDVSLPSSLYAASKRMDELMAEVYTHAFHLRMTGLRFFTVYGPWGRPDMAYYSFTDKILKGEPIAVYNGGNMERDFTYINDIVHGILNVVKWEEQGHTIFNLGHNKPVSLMEFIGLLEKLLGKKAQIEFKEMQKGDVLKTYASIDKAKRLLGYTTPTALEEGLGSFIDWYCSYTGI